MRKNHKLKIKINLINKIIKIMSLSKIKLKIQRVKALRRKKSVFSNNVIWFVNVS